MLSPILQVTRDFSVLQGFCSPIIFVPHIPSLSLLVLPQHPEQPLPASPSLSLTPPTSTFYATFQPLPEFASLTSQLLHGLSQYCYSFKKASLLSLPQFTPFSHALLLLSWVFIFIFLPCLQRQDIEKGQQRAKSAELHPETEEHSGFCPCCVTLGKPYRLFSGRQLSHRQMGLGHPLQKLMCCASRGAMGNAKNKTLSWLLLTY